MGRKYVQQNQHYSYNSMKTRTQLATIHLNCNVGRGVATTMSGEQRFKCVYPKLQKQWVAKPLYEENSFQFVQDLLHDPISLKLGVINVPQLERPGVPQSIASTPGGNKEDIIARQVSRFR